MRTYRGDTFADVYEKALRDTLENPDYTSKPRGMEIKEISNAALVIDDPYFPLYENQKRSSQFKYIAGETVWYFTGRKDIDFISKYSKFWGQLDNGDGTVNSAYGNLLFKERLSDGRNQYQWALDSLIEDKDSRQAIVHFNKPSHQWKGNKDFVCTLNGVFQIRDNRLNFTVDMRSNDLILGTATDVAFFCLLQQQMLRHLQLTYPNLKMGSYTHIVHSLHIYERHFNLVKEMLSHPFSHMSYPPLKKNLITIKGDSTDALNLLELNIEKEIVNANLVINDSLFKWLSDYSFQLTDI
jgi:thymidylate synthase